MWGLTLMLHNAWSIIVYDAYRDESLMSGTFYAQGMNEIIQVQRYIVIIIIAHNNERRYKKTW